MDHNLLKYGSRCLSLMALSAVLVGSLSACGGEKKEQDEAQGSTSAVTAPEYIYVPEFTDLGSENTFYDSKVIDGALYYLSGRMDEETGEWVQGLFRRPLEGGEESEIPLQLEEGSSGINYWDVALDGTVCIMTQDYQYDEATQTGTSTYALVKLDSEGSPLFTTDITDALTKNGEQLYPYGMCVDGQGRFYVSGENGIWLFDAEGASAGSISTSDWVNELFTGKDGVVYASYYSSSSSGMVVAPLDADTKSVGTPLEGIKGDHYTPMTEGSFFTYDSVSGYTYDIASQTSEKLFDWLDSDINGSYVNAAAVLEDGRIAAIYRDWATDESGMAFLTKTPSSQVAAKQYILIGTLSTSQAVQAAAVAFNRQSEEYHISIKQYLDYDNWTETTYTDAITSLFNDITSDNCPDIICIAGLNAEQLAAKEVFEDLTPYLEQSTALDRSDMLENVLEAYTFDGVLAGIPKSFYMTTLVGNGEMVGEKPGWTLEDMIALADAHPDAELFDRYSNARILNACLNYNMERYVDWKEARCDFTSEEFKKLLEFAARFPDEDDINWNSESSTPGRISRGEVLLDIATIYDFDEVQMYTEMFQGDAVYIGYPNSTGESGCVLNTDEVLSISARSPVKDGAWAFLESYLSRDDTWYSFGFPNSKKELEEMAKEAVEVTYVLDANGEPLLDENGEPIEEGAGSSVSYGSDWSYDYRKATQEEVDLVMELMETAKPVASTNDQIWTIIQEEAEPFFQGQKTAEEVAGIIQSRVGIYIDENS